MLLIWRKNRTLLTSACLILLISGCGLKGPLYQTPKAAPQTLIKDTQKAVNNTSQTVPKDTVTVTKQATKS
ncbi:MAG: lipoprotein [Alteromonadaceae bacterium]|nr:lipoprotein [Alteromonadaceae bacterium]